MACVVARDPREGERERERKGRREVARLRCVWCVVGGADRQTASPGPSSRAEDGKSESEKGWE